MAQQPTHEVDDELETPIKISWTGVARRKIKGLNLDFDSDQSDRVVAALDRQKTNVVIRTVDEATAVASEMRSYVDCGGRDGRVWMNGPASKACERVMNDVVDAMRERGFEPERTSAGFITDFVPADELEGDADDDSDDDPDAEPGDEVMHPLFDEPKTVESVEDGFVRTDDGGATSIDSVEVVDDSSGEGSLDVWPVDVDATCAAGGCTEPATHRTETEVHGATIQPAMCEDHALELDEGGDA